MKEVPIGEPGRCMQVAEVRSDVLGEMLEEDVSLGEEGCCG